MRKVLNKIYEMRFVIGKALCFMLVGLSTFGVAFFSIGIIVYGIDLRLLTGVLCAMVDLSLSVVLLLTVNAYEKVHYEILARNNTIYEGEV